MTAISDQVEILNYEVHARSVTFDIFNFFIAPLAAIVHGKDIVLIMENVPSHKNVENVYTEVVFKKLPQHSLFFNSIEECFSVFKAYLKQHLNGVVNLNYTPARAVQTASLSTDCVTSRPSTPQDERNTGRHSEALKHL